jgi:hypothetical protein
VYYLSEVGGEMVTEWTGEEDGKGNKRKQRRRKVWQRWRKGRIRVREMF